jgi:hypothetical protein
LVILNGLANWVVLHFHKPAEVWVRHILWMRWMDQSSQLVLGKKFCAVYPEWLLHDRNGPSTFSQLHSFPQDRIDFWMVRDFHQWTSLC